MLIRTPPMALERKRVPIGPVRANREHRLYTYCRGLWLWQSGSFGIDLMGMTPPLTLAASTAFNSHVEGPALDTTPAASCGASTTFASGHPLYITSGHGLSTFVRFAPGPSHDGDLGAIFGIAYNGTGNPYVVNEMFRSSTSAAHMYWGWNYSGTYTSLQSINALSSDIVRSHVLSHTFGVSVKGYTAGAELISDTTNTAAPTFGTSPILVFGRDGVNTGRNSNARIHICAVFAHGLTAQDAQDLEANPYALVEPARSWVTGYTAPPPPPPPPPSGPFPFKIKSITAGGLQDLGGLIIR